MTPPPLSEAEQAIEDAMLADLLVSLATIRVGIDALRTLLDTPNAEINASPAQFIKDVARESRRGLRATLRLARMIGEVLDTDVGVD